MVHFILGDCNSGKSTRFLSLFNKEQGGIGLFSKKLYNENNVIIGYNLVLLPENKEIPFIKLKESLSDQSESDSFFQGRFAFSIKSFQIGEDYILNNLNSNMVWIDEIGGLELKGLGYNSLLKTLLIRDIDLVLSVRTSLFDDILKRYNIKDYNLFQ